jgi:hypothetical protein
MRWVKVISSSQLLLDAMGTEAAEAHVRSSAKIIFPATPFSITKVIRYLFWRFTELYINSIIDLLLYV